MFDDEDPAHEQRERARVRQALGDPKTITAEVVAWVNERARQIRAAGGFAGLMESFHEGHERFPECRWVGALLYLAVSSGRDMEVPKLKGDE